MLIKQAYMQSNQDEVEQLPKKREAKQQSKLADVKPLVFKLEDRSTVESLSAGEWDDIEKLKFTQAIRQFGKDYQKIANFIETRDRKSVRTYAKILKKRINSTAHPDYDIFVMLSK